MSDDNFKHISVGLNQMLVNLRRKMDENKRRERRPETLGKVPQANEEDAA